MGGVFEDCEGRIRVYHEDIRVWVFAFDEGEF